jgi:hypothetical protein
VWVVWVVWVVWGVSGMWVVWGVLGVWGVRGVWNEGSVGSLLTFDIPQTALVATLDTHDFYFSVHNEIVWL